MVTLAEIFRQYGPAYRSAFADELLPSQVRVMWCIEHCRTEALGGHLYHCEACGEMVYRYHSCRNRHCNQCQEDKAQAWLFQQQALLLPVPHFLVTFTLPRELRSLAYRNQRVVYHLLFRSAAEALQELATDPRFVGGQIGMVGVLHTWKRDLQFHPHVHFLVPGGGLDFVNGRWLPARNYFFVRVEPLALLFRAKLRDGLKQAGLYHQVPATAWHKAWVVHSKAVGYGGKAVTYLADYVFRVGISNSRILKLENDEVTFWYKDNKTKRRLTVTLPVFTFIRRFLQHVLPQGFVKLRYFGFFAVGNRHRLTLARELLAADVRRPPQPATALTLPLTLAQPATPTCPHGGQPMRCVQTLLPHARSPPPRK
jgi:hypothetical protein